MPYFIKIGNTWTEVPKPNNKMADIRVSVNGVPRELWNSFPKLEIIEVHYYIGIQFSMQDALGNYIFRDGEYGDFRGSSDKGPLQVTGTRDPGGNVSGSSGYYIDFTTGEIGLQISCYHSAHGGSPSAGVSCTIVRVNNTWYYYRRQSSDTGWLTYVVNDPALKAVGPYQEFFERYYWNGVKQAVTATPRIAHSMGGAAKGGSHIVKNAWTKVK